MDGGPPSLDRDPASSLPLAPHTSYTHSTQASHLPQKQHLSTNHTDVPGPASKCTSRCHR